MKINQPIFSNYENFQNYNKKVDNFSQSLNSDKEKLKKAATEFESYFLNMMFKSMKKTVVPAVEKSNAQKTFEEMMEQQVCDKIAKSGGIGFADMIYKNLEKNQ